MHLEQVRQIRCVSLYDNPVTKDLEKIIHMRNMLDVVKSDVYHKSNNDEKKSSEHHLHNWETSEEKMSYKNLQSINFIIDFFKL